MSNHPESKDVNLSYSKKVVEQAHADELMTILKSLKSSELKSISTLIDIHLGKPKFIGKQLAELCLDHVKKLELFVEYEFFANTISLELFNFCEKRLQDSYANPTREQIHDLLPDLIQNYGVLRTQFLFATCIDGEQNVADIAKNLFSTHGALSFAVIEKVAESSDIFIPVRQVSPELKQSRKAKKMIRREKRAHVKEQQEKAKETVRDSNKRQRILQKLKRNTIEIVEADTANHAVNSPPQIVKRLHPHISRFQEANLTDANVGKVGMAFIWFTGPTRGSGKTRPVLIIAKTKKHYIVRPIYSNARRPAGSWRAVVVNDWQVANLSHPSVVGDETHKIKFDRLRLIGELTLSDWNRVCLGEVNSRS